ncbi:hypothetical protein EVAR_10428_1 [Eumeta japonica]|uniref:Uncharacterized protein n=1 Tax=Eumeta variegata TaxID=151549 RepID=A0A4C1UCN1_EUMVA|nr:hypothetical protein EVAR_10428_1 [Eumeta japonica]
MSVDVTCEQTDECTGHRLNRLWGKRTWRQCKGSPFLLWQRNLEKHRLSAIAGASGENPSALLDDLKKICVSIPWTGCYYDCGRGPRPIISLHTSEIVRTARRRGPPLLSTEADSAPAGLGGSAHEPPATAEAVAGR